MADVKSYHHLYYQGKNAPAINRKNDADPLFLRQKSLFQAIETLFFAYRDFTAEADLILQHHGYGRAHHRAIYFIARNPNITVTALLDILKITKQSLSRVLRQLVDDGYVIQTTDEYDRRYRHLSLSDKGNQLADELTACQCQMLAKAFKQSGADNVAGFHQVMQSIIINEKDRDYLKNYQQHKSPSSA